MRLLLDTQIALWWLIGSSRLKSAARERIAASECVVSVASVWEVAIKHRIGKLPIDAETFAAEMREAGATILPVSDAHVTAYGKLPDGHRDPFDLLLAATARVERLRLITADNALLAFARVLPDVATEKP